MSYTEIYACKKDKTDAVDFPVVFSVAFNKGTNFEMTILNY